MMALYTPLQLYIMEIDIGDFDPMTGCSAGHVTLNTKGNREL